MPKVLFIAPSAYVLGGVQSWLDYVAPGLRRYGWQARVGLASGRWHDAEQYRAAHPALDAFAIANPTGSREGRIRAIADAISDRPVDVVVSVNIPDAIAAGARVRRANAGLRLAVALHGLEPDLFDDVAGFASVLDGVICTNRLSMAIASRHGVADNRVHYAPYGIVPPDVEAPSRTHGMLTLAYVGRIEQSQKRVLDIGPTLDALHLQGIAFRLLVAGAGPDEGALRSQLQAHTAAGRVAWLGALQSAELASRVYRVADVLLLPSMWETGPIVAWEAMAHGVVVLSAHYIGSGLEDALHDDENCLMFPVRDAAFAASQAARLADPALRRRLADEAKRLVEARYTEAASVLSWSVALDTIWRRPAIVAAQEPGYLPSGRLDRWLGTSRAETVRNLCGRRFEHASPGGEWPHSYGRRPADDSEYWKQAEMIDGARP